MADLRESFPVTENTSTGAGVALGSVVEGNAGAAINGSIGFSFKDGSGNVKLAPIKVAGAAPGDAIPTLGFRDSTGNLIAPQLNSSGQLPVTFDVAADNKTGRGLLTGTATAATVASITLVASKTYQNIEVSVACFRDTVFQLIKSDNAVETVLADILVGSGQYTAFLGFENLEFTSGATGTQLLIVKGANLTALSDMRATIACKQL